MPSLPSKLKYFLIIAENCGKIEVKIFPYFALSQETESLSNIFFHDCLWKQLFGSNSSQSSSNLILWTNLVTMRFFTQFQLKLEQLSCKKVLNFILLDNYFADLFTEIQIRYPKTFKFGPGRFLERKSKFQPKYDCS